MNYTIHLLEHPALALRGDDEHEADYQARLRACDGRRRITVELTDESGLRSSTRLVSLLFAPIDVGAALKIALATINDAIMERERSKATAAEARQLIVTP